MTWRKIGYTAAVVSILIVCGFATHYRDKVAELHIDAAATLVGVYVSIVGFGLALLQIAAVRRAADASSDAVRGLILRISTFEDAVLCDSARNIVAEIDRMHVTATTADNYAAHVYLPERYRALRDVLVELRARLATDLSAEDKTTFQATISKLSDFERTVTRGLQHQRYPRLDPLVRTLQNLSELLVPISLTLHEQAVNQDGAR